jgi:hypothetical protein
MIVGIVGKIRHGKDAIAQHLAARWGFTVLPFAGALKEEVLARMPRTLAAIHRLNPPCPVCGPTREMGPACLRRDVYDTKPPGIRELLQEYGSEVRRGDDPDYWVDRWAERAAEIPGKIAVPDVRFHNEALRVIMSGGVLIKVVRPNYGEVSDHVSERLSDEWKTWTAVLVNDGDLSALHRKVDVLMERFA